MKIKIIKPLNLEQIIIQEFSAIWLNLEKLSWNLKTSSPPIKFLFSISFEIPFAVLFESDFFKLKSMKGIFLIFDI